MPTLTSLFAYKTWANAELFESLAKVDAAAHLSELHAATRIMNHIFVVDSIFKGHLQGQSHGYTDTNTPDTPPLADLALRAKAVDAWFESHVSNLAPDRLKDDVVFTFTDGDVGRMTQEQILLHVIAHGTYHRGAVGQVMRATNVPPPRDLLTRFLRLERAKAAR